MSTDFLVQLDDKPTFLTAMRGDKAYGSSFPTQAVRMSYAAADDICGRLRKQDYDAVIVDKYGQPPTASDLAAVKKFAEYEVVFSQFYFCGCDANGRELGSKDRKLAVRMSQSAAEEVCRKLRKMGHSDACKVEIASPSLGDIEEELKEIWPDQTPATQE
jgi:hypothetical protein